MTATLTSHPLAEDSTHEGHSGLNRRVRDETGFFPTVMAVISTVINTAYITITSF